MLFNSFPFIFLFLPISLIGFYAAARLGTLAARLWLVTASFAFYIWWHPAFAVLLTCSIAFNFLCGAAVRKLRDHPAQVYFLTFAVGANLTALFYYKYAFALSSWLVHEGALKQTWANGVLLPLGISFFTFTQIGLLLDSKDGAIKDNNLVDYILFVTFFPHLIAGPILHHKEIMPQFRDPETYRFHHDNFARGCVLFVIGMLKKVVIADTFSFFVSTGFSSPGSLQFFSSWGTVLCYSLQLYFDFSGYSDMAIGIARMFNVRFPLNFNSPYKATNIIDFWARWHMTLTRYLTLYLFNPLAAHAVRQRAARGLPISRKALAKPGPFLSTVVVPITVTMGLAGIWHGAGLQFMIFGLLHAFYLVCNHTWRTFGPKKDANAKPSMPVWMSTALSVGITYLAVLLGQVFFRAPSAHDAVAILGDMVGRHGWGATIGVPRWLPAKLGSAGAWLSAHGLIHQVGTTEDGTTNVRMMLEMVACYFIVWFTPNSQTIAGAFETEKSAAQPKSEGLASWIPHFEMNARWGLAVGLFAAISLLEIGAKSEFLYFQF